MLLASNGARATTTSYADRQADFIIDTGATSIGTLPFGALFPSTVGPVTFENGRPDTIGGFGDSSNELPGTDVSFGNTEDFTLRISGGAYAIGFQVHEPGYRGGVDVVTGCNSPCADSTFTIELFAGATSLGKLEYNAPDDMSDLPGGPVGFFGVRSTLPFDRVVILENQGNFDNEYFGGFLLSPVPEPSAFALWALGGLVLWGASRRRR